MSLRDVTGSDWWNLEGGNNPAWEDDAAAVYPLDLDPDTAPVGFGAKPVLIGDSLTKVEAHVLLPHSSQTRTLLMRVSHDGSTVSEVTVPIAAEFEGGLILSLEVTETVIAEYDRGDGTLIYLQWDQEVGIT